jgi:hypothetical protein
LLKKYGKVATMEVAEVFGITLSDARELLDILKRKKLLIELPAGNDFFYILRSVLNCGEEICRSI